MYIDKETELRMSNKDFKEMNGSQLDSGYKSERMIMDVLDRMEKVSKEDQHKYKDFDRW